MKNIIKYLLSIFFVFSGLSLWAQGTCSDQLRLAQRRYEGGLLDEIPSILASCLEKGFTKEEKTNAYKLLIQSYIFSDQIQKADEVMLNFLRDFPEYTITPADYKEFISLYNTYRTEPIMKIEASVGGNSSMLWVNEYYGLENLNANNPKYSMSAGFNAEVNYINNLFTDFDGSFGLSYSFMRIGYWNVPYEYTTISASYNNMYFGIPLALRYNKNLLGIDFFAKGGLEPVMLLYSKIDFTRTRVGYQDDITGTEDVIDFQRKFDIRPLLSVGVNLNIWNANLMVTSGLKFGTVMPSDGLKRYSNDELYQKYYFIFDDYLINQVFLNISYVFSIYNPKKIK